MNPSRRTRVDVSTIVLVLFLAAAGAVPAEPRGASASASDWIGPDRCQSCHPKASANFSHTIHRGVRLERDGLTVSGCEACHGPGAKHARQPFDAALIIRFSSTSVQSIARQNGQCLLCHDGGERIHWRNSTHERHDLACADCHNPMARLSSRGLLANTSINETCFACHQQQRAEFNRRSHMPLPEGKLSCVSCHNPHGGVTDPLLRTVRLNDTCFECHAEKRGPFLWEHAPVRESCTQCHLPHGSNHDMLLNAPRPLLCQQCHSQLGHPNDLLTRANLAGGARPDARLIGRSCSNCHVNVHGSNHPSGLKLVR